MPTRSDAEEHLRIIRSLMEKATIYRAISAEAAAVGGVLAIAASFAFGNWLTASPGELAPKGPGSFFVLWLAVLVLAGVCNAVLLYRGAKRRGEVFASTGMRMAVAALLPSFLVAGFFTLLLSPANPFLPDAHLYPWIVPVWMTCYGLALLATAHFAPRSLWWLGWAFLIAGLFAFPQFIWAEFSYLGMSGVKDPSRMNEPIAILWAQRWMAGTFGLFHLIYAACAWPRKTAAEA
jgi:hypothetical protein